MKSMKSKIESLLFVAAKPMSVKRISSLLEEKDIEKIKTVLLELSDQYKNEERGIRIVQNETKFQMVSASENSDLVKKLVKDEMTGELSKPSLETLTIIAYRGPISKIDLDRIRGVNCSLILKNLSMRGLVEVKMNEKTDDTYYKVSLDFLKFLGVSSAKDLPDYEKLNNTDVVDRVIEDEKSKENV